MVNEDTPLPVNMDTFWASGSNKVKLQILLSKWIRQNANNIWPNVELVLSIDGIATDCIAVNNGNENCIESLKLHVEEGDVRIVPHAINIAKHGYKRIVLLSNDTDVTVLGLHFWSRLSTNGLEELWIRA
ncbi:hypothetical protein DPMN_006019 [Dreissena polymorpha]|uniref:Uncharacterized protein n=1 Tax=Dreissena polymorpha TaxID=45954 RepID=A0A9D4LQU8_DREPO|nr:hypothetical protein DPMN_025145 [Dreissena polymorpha]KAH3882088.1 hypothetical protein DPMN_006019 [Dreissena polymorpha]